MTTTIQNQIPILMSDGWTELDAQYGQIARKHKGIEVNFKDYKSLAVMSIVKWPAAYDINLTVEHKDKSKTVTLYRHTDISEPPCLTNEQIFEIAHKVGADLLEELVKLSLTGDLEKRYPWVHDEEFMDGVGE